MVCFFNRKGAEAQSKATRHFDPQISLIPQMQGKIRRVDE